MLRSYCSPLTACLVLLLGGTLWAQAPVPDAPTAQAQAPATAAAAAAKPVLLNQNQKLQVENYAKDVKLAEQQIELLKVQLAAALMSERQSAGNFTGYLAKLRVELSAPADKYDFDGQTLSFVAKGAKPAAPTAAGTTAKPAVKKSGSGPS